MISIQPELWVDRGAKAIAFYQEAFDARVLHVVGSGEDIVAQLAVGDAAFWIAAIESGGDRLVPRTVGGTTSRTLLVVEDPDSIFSRAVAADEHHSSLGPAWSTSGMPVTLGGMSRARVGGRWRLDPGFEVRARGPLDQNRHKVAHGPAIELLVVSVHDLLEGVGGHFWELLAQPLHYPRYRLGLAGAMAPRISAGGPVHDVLHAPLMWLHRYWHHRWLPRQEPGHGISPTSAWSATARRVI